MASEEIHNENSGIAESVFQVGAVHGDVVMLPHSTARPGVSVAQVELARNLAAQVKKLSAWEVEHWGIRGPDALSVRWHTASEDLLDHWEKIHGNPGSTAPAPLTGQFTAIRETYQTIHSKRLVILGRAGAGKTVLAHRLILDLVDNASVTGPVPVLFSISDWNPASTRLRVWLVQQLIRDYPFLDDRDPISGRRGAEELVDGDLILPVLDGFDEIPDKHHRAAINEISKVDCPLIVTSRPKQYAEAARTVKAVGGSAAIELEDLTLDETHRYLRQSTSKSRSAEWDEFFDQLRTAPETSVSQNLTRVLATPLMVMLARTIYNDIPNHNPCELLDIGLFPTRKALEEHLLGAYLGTLYDPRRSTGRADIAQRDWNIDQVRHWLGYLATHLTQRNTHDFTWWQLPSTLHRSTRMLATMTTAGFTFWLWGSLTTGVMDGTNGPVRGLAFGLMLGLVNEVRFLRHGLAWEPDRLRIGLRGRSSMRTYLRRSASGLLTGLLAGFAVAIPVATGGVIEAVPNAGHGAGLSAWFWNMRDQLVMVGFMVGLANIIVSFLGIDRDPREAINPWQLLNTDRTVTLVRTIVSALVLILGVTLIGVLQYGPEDAVPFFLQIGIHYGLYGGMAGLILSAWGSWLLFGCFLLPLTRRLPWRSKHFLEDAYRRGVLRRAGAVYQFRHARLRDHLATNYRTKVDNG